MKKLFSKVIIAVIIVAVIFCSACSFIKTPEKQDTSYNSISAAQTVTANPIEDRAVKSRVQAVSEVYRANVAVKISASGSTSYGSGVIVDMTVYEDETHSTVVSSADDYFVITCHHVISGKGEIVLYVPDDNGRNFTDSDYNSDYAFSGTVGGVTTDAQEVRLVGGDRESDIAVLKITLSADKKARGVNLVKAKLMDPAAYSLTLGEDVFAIGNPSGACPGTVSSGIVSYIGRTVTLSSIGEMWLVQIDVQTNHGSSGGALYNLCGELVGITNSGSDEYEGLNYAIPLTVPGSPDKGVYNVACQLIGSAYKNPGGYGYVSGRWRLGLSASDGRSGFGFNSPNVCYVSAIDENGAAYAAGVRKDDIIVSVGGIEVSTQSAFESAMNKLYAQKRAGDTLDIMVSRNNTNMNFNVTLTQYIFGV